MNMKQKIFHTLVVEGKQRSPAQLAAQLGTTADAVAARVSEIRRDGFAIYANRSVDSKGRVKTFYKHSTPTRKLIAAGYRALSMGL